MLTIMSFDPIGPAIGGAFIGLGAALLMLLIGRLAGVGGILGSDGVQE